MSGASSAEDADTRALVTLDAAAILDGPTPPATVSKCDVTTWRIAFCASLAYALSYFWRYPIFILPETILHQRFATVGGTDLDLQAAFSLAFILGFGVAKPFAAVVVSSRLFFSRRIVALSFLLAASMLVECVGLPVFAGAPGAQVACVFVSSFFSSWLYGAAATYLEGRRTTEVLLAVLSFFLIYAGNLSRGTAALVLQAGCPPLLMPLAIGAVACPISIALYVAVDRAPPPSAADVATRSKRTAMTGAQRAAFLRRWGVFVAPQCAAYALLTGIRSVRDLYSQQIFAESLGVAEAPPYVFLIADLPGAICGGAVLLLLSRVPSNERAVFFNLGAQAASAVLLLSSTILFALKGLPGLAWQLAAGTGIFVPYLVMQTPIFERLLAVAQSEGTLSFLIFLSDGIGYVVSITLLLYRDFAPATAVAGGELALFERMAGGCAAACLVLTAVSALFFRGAIGRAKRSGEDAEAGGGGSVN